MPGDEPMIPRELLPAYLAEAFGDLYEQDGLIVLGKGLGALPLLASFVRWYSDPEEGHGSDGKNSPPEKQERPLIIVLGLAEAERIALVHTLESWGTPPAWLPRVVSASTNNQHESNTQQNQDRAQLYQKGGVLCITSRILIVDLLTGVASPDRINGFLVAHAERVNEQSTEAFILRIFMSQKQPFGSGFVKAFSDAPETLMQGFANVDKVLKSLQCANLYLYPRFRDSIRNELEENPPIVIDIQQQLTPKQQEIQLAIAAAVQACVRELKKSCTKIEWNNTDLSIQNCVTSAFDRAISRQLESEWHHLHPHIKQLVQDLRTLRTLFHYLIHYDSISFWKLINSIKSMSAASRHTSMWLLTSAADQLFRVARDRVYQIEYEKANEDPLSKPIAKLKTILEENPKWRLLRQLLDEIKESEQNARDENHERDEPVNVLVMTRDERTVRTLRIYLVEGRERCMYSNWLSYLQHYNDRSRSIVNSHEGTSFLSEEHRLLVEEEFRINRFLHGHRNKNTHRKKQKLNEVPLYEKKRKRIAEERSRGNKIHQADDLEREAILEKALGSTEHELETQVAACENDETSHEIDALFQVSYAREVRVVIRSCASIEGDQALLLLHDISPKYVIMYDADLGFMRSVEIYSSLQSAYELIQIKVYFLVFTQSAEEKVFTRSVEKEQNAFERLIHHKRTMPPPMLQSSATQEVQQAMHHGTLAGTYLEGAFPLAVDTRTGRGKHDASKVRRDIAVDVREFRSALPSVLHQGGMRLAPVTLTVGDFVLSNVHCVERKSLSDLFSSFASGRLYTQCEAMCKYYEVPCVLIEFDPCKSFSLQNVNSLGVDVTKESVCGRMCLLTMHFPKIRLLWSRSPQETLKIFHNLKQNHQEVDVDRAMDIGREDSEESLIQQKDDEDEINDVAREMLLRLPGVNTHSARKIMSNVNSLAELAELSRDELRKIAGPITGQKLYTFFKQRLGST